MRTHLCRSVTCKRVLSPHGNTPKGVSSQRLYGRNYKLLICHNIVSFCKYTFEHLCFQINRLALTPTLNHYIPGVSANVFSKTQFGNGKWLYVILRHSHDRIRLPQKQQTDIHVSITAWYCTKLYKIGKRSDIFQRHKIKQ